MAAKGSWFEIYNECDKPCDVCYRDLGYCGQAHKQSYNIYKDPITDDGMKKSLKGLLCVMHNEYDGELEVIQECSEKLESQGELQVIYKNGKFYNQTSLTKIREKLKSI